MSSISVERVTSRERFEALADDWNAFVASLPPDSLFARHSFARANFDISMRMRRDQLLVFVFREGNRIVGLAPFVKRVGPLGLITLHWAESRTSLYAVFPVAPEAEAAVFAELRACLLSEARLRKIRVDFVPDGSVLARFLKGLGARSDEGVPTFATTLGGDVLSRLSKKRRATVRRLHRRLEDLGSLEHRIVTDAESVARTLDWLFDRKIAQFESAYAVTPWIAWPETRTYFIATGVAMAEKGHACASELLLDGQCIAASFLFRDRDQAWLSKIAYDPAYSGYSLGWIDLTMGFEALRQRGIQRIDMMMGTSLYKESLGEPSGTTRRYRLAVNPIGASLRAWFAARSGGQAS